MGRLSTFGFAVLSACLLLGAGCANYKPLPQTYLQPAHSAAIVIRKIPEHPQMMDSGQGGLVGAIITATSRTERMREQLAGIQGDNVKDAFLEEFKRRMGEHFKLEDGPVDLRIEVMVDTWGWYVPTTSFGIKVGEYQSQLMGRVIVYETSKNEKIGYANVQIEQPIGLKPQEESARAAVTEVARAFAIQAEEALVHSLKPYQARLGYY